MKVLSPRRCALATKAEGGPRAVIGHGRPAPWATGDLRTFFTSWRSSWAVRAKIRRAAGAAVARRLDGGKGRRLAVVVNCVVRHTGSPSEAIQFMLLGVMNIGLPSGGGRPG